MVAQRHGRVQETQLKCTKARNDYLLNLAAANAAMNKYYLQDVSTLIDVGTRPFVCVLLLLSKMTSMRQETDIAPPCFLLPVLRPGFPPLCGEGDEVLPDQ